MKAIGMAFLFTIFASLQAIGVGVGVQQGYGFGETYHNQRFRLENESFRQTRTTYTKSTRTGFGMVLDTNAFRNSVFNMRFRLGSATVTRDWGRMFPYEPEVEMKTTMTYVDCAMGFGIYRTPYSRFWFGPKLQIGNDAGEETRYSTIASSEYKNTTWETNLASYAVGAVYAYNYRIHELMAVSLELSILYRRVFGHVNIEWQDSYYKSIENKVEIHDYMISLELVTFFTPWERIWDHDKKP